MPGQRGRPRKVGEDSAMFADDQIKQFQISEEKMAGDKKFHFIVRDVKKYPQMDVPDAITGEEFDAYVESWLDKGYKVQNSFIQQANDVFVTVGVFLVA